jgi:hypothetical protein
VLNKVETHRIVDYKQPFQDPQLEMVLASIIEGNTVGELWVMDSQADRCGALLWDQGNNVFYISGEDLDQAVQQSMSDLINGEIRDESIRKERAYFKVHALSDNAEAYLPKIFTRIQLTHFRKRFYAFKSSRSNPVSDPGIKCANIEIIDRDFMQRTALCGLHQNVSSGSVLALRQFSRGKSSAGVRLSI